MKRSHIYIINGLLLSIVIAIGLLSILATSSFFSPPFYSLYTHPSIVCKGSETTLIWENASTEDASRVTLSASPLENLSPKLDRKKVELTGRLKVQVLGEVTVSLDARPKNGIYQDQVTINLVPQEVCQSFSFNPMGFYEGTIEISSPQEETLEKWIDIIWSDSFKQLSVEMGSRFDSRLDPVELTLICDDLTENKELSCTVPSSDVITLAGKFTDSGFEGNYKEKGTDPQEGTFNFLKQ